MQMMASLSPLPKYRGIMVQNIVPSSSYKKKTATSCISKDVIIVGAGVAGSALAHTLGKDGYQVHLLERSLKEPNRITGDMLQPGGYLKLVELGLQDCVDQGIDAQRILGYVVYHKGKVLQVPYPLEKCHPFYTTGRTFHNGRFVQRLRNKAASLSNVKLERGTVTSLIKSRGTIKGVEYKTKTGHCIGLHAPLTIVCDGCVSNLRSSLSKNSKADTLSYFVALTLENYQLPRGDYSYIVMEGPSTLVFYHISSTEVRCMVEIPGQKLPSISNGDMVRFLKTKVAPQVPRELYNAFLSAVDSGGIRAMPCKSMSASPTPLPGAILLGDALNMRHPATGGGMMCALRDVVLLRDLLRPLLDLSNTTELSRCIQLFYNLRKAKASIVNIAAETYYKVNNSKVKDEIWENALYYASHGDLCSRGPVSLLSGIDRCPLELALHFSAMSAVTMSRLLLSNPSPAGLWASGRLIYDTMSLIFPILEDGVKDLYFNEVNYLANQDDPR